MKRYSVIPTEIRIATTSPIPLSAVIVARNGRAIYVIDTNHIAFIQGYTHAHYLLKQVNTLSFFKRMVWMSPDADMNTEVYLLDNIHFKKELIVDE